MSADELPDLYKVKFLPGGIDILTNKEIKTTLSNVSTKSDLGKSSFVALNVSPATTIKSVLVENKIAEKKSANEDLVVTEIAEIVDDTKKFVASKLEISEQALESDYIKVENADAFKANVKLAVITETLTDVVKEIDTDISQDKILHQIALEFEKTMIEEESSNADIKISDIINTKVNVIVRLSVKEELINEVGYNSTIVSNIKSITDVVLETLDTKLVADDEEEITFIDTAQDLLKSVKSTTDFVAETLESSDLVNSQLQKTRDEIKTTISEKKEATPNEQLDSLFGETPEEYELYYTPTPTNTETTTETPIPTPYYELVSSSSNMEEGDEITITLLTELVPDGTEVKYSVSHPHDFYNVGPVGTFIVKDGTASVKLKAVEEFALEGTEQIQIKLEGSSLIGQEWHFVKVTIDLSDKSTPSPTYTETETPVPTPVYELSSSASTINEGDEVTLNLATKNVPIGTEVSYSVSHPDDFYNLGVAGKFVVSEDGTASVKLKAIEEFKLEGTREITIQLNGSSYEGSEWHLVKVTLTILNKG